MGRVDVRSKCLACQRGLNLIKITVEINFLIDKFLLYCPVDKENRNVLKTFPEVQVNFHLISE